MQRFSLNTLALAMTLATACGTLNAAPLLDPSPQLAPSATHANPANSWLEIDQAAFEGNIAKLQQAPRFAPPTSNTVAAQTNLTAPSKSSVWSPPSRSTFFN